MKTGHAALSISLPRTLRKFVEQRVARAGFGNVSEYIRSLIRSDQEQGKTPSPPLRGLVQPPAPTPVPMVRDGSGPAGHVVVDFTAEHWRELRSALIDGEQRLMARRIAEAADLWRSMLTMRRAALRQEAPGVSEAEIDLRLAGWLREQTQEPEDPFLVPASAERIARILHG